MDDFDKFLVRFGQETVGAISLVFTILGAVIVLLFCAGWIYYFITGHFWCCLRG